MGACTFMETASGGSMREAFRSAVEDALYENGHGGYSGSIAEKSAFTEIKLPEGEKPYDYANKLMDEDDSRVSNKWGPAGAIDCGNNRYLFFGWASE